MLNIVETFRQAFLDKRFRGKDQAIAFERNFQIVARRESQLVVQFFRNGDLSADSDLDNRYGPTRLGLYFHIIISYGNAYPCQ